MNGLIFFSKDCIFQICNLFDKKNVFFHSFYLIYPSNKGGDYINTFRQLPWQRNATTVYKLHTSTCFKLKNKQKWYIIIGVLYTFNKDSRSRHYLHHFVLQGPKWLVRCCGKTGTMQWWRCWSERWLFHYHYLNGYFSKPSQNNINKSTKYFTIFFSFFAFL